MAFVYMVRCADGSLYTGYAEDVQRRVAVHNAGKGARYTRARRPVTLAYQAAFADRAAAQREEARLKRLTRAQKCALCQAWQAKQPNEKEPD